MNESGSTSPDTQQHNAVARNALFELSEGESPSDGQQNQDMDVEWECVIDNTVNRVMESYRNILGDLDEAETQDEGDHVRETAILSAIDVHGLYPGHSDVVVGDAGQLPQIDRSTDPDDEEIDLLAISSAINSQGLSISTLVLPCDS